VSSASDEAQWCSVWWLPLMLMLTPGACPGPRSRQGQLSSLSCFCGAGLACTRCWQSFTLRKRSASADECSKVLTHQHWVLQTGAHSQVTIARRCGRRTVRWPLVRCCRPSGSCNHSGFTRLKARLSRPVPHAPSVRPGGGHAAVPCGRRPPACPGSWLQPCPCRRPRALAPGARRKRGSSGCRCLVAPAPRPPRCLRHVRAALRARSGGACCSVSHASIVPTACGAAMPAPRASNARCRICRSTLLNPSNLSRAHRVAEGDHSRRMHDERGDCNGQP